ncbi:MAG: 2-oxoacid:acceptor oxidoreductase subunit alpha [Acidobacteria bacterium]|nr:2-oxoacid:acceptor oxidoreductase subunit alpha [Acidobacteriota bacterium]NIN71348.1 2-oxoacid:acceptor oxidoreductase subunit alpha [Gemmatimonadota bacterium]NIP64334.1 2-oxoacid:acceptor oxidoreductase subunit alpha [Gammaproteobacteria bacterium]NIQ85791.1 2-oxoacid:acceptor oxidoreductase subunit alpha [Acidobacteriota bacterium]
MLQPDTKATRIEEVDEHIVEFVSDSGEGAQTAGQMFGTVSAKMGNGVWTVEIIPAEIEPPPRSQAGASGNRIRISGSPVTNMGRAADVVVAFNEQVLYNRIADGALREGTILFLESVWADSPDEQIRRQYVEAKKDFKKRGYVVIEVPMDVECRKIVPDPRRGKNMWALGMIAAIYERDLTKIETLIEQRLGRKGEKIVSANQTLVRAGYEWAEKNVDFRYRVAVEPSTEERVVMNGNKALALGVVAAGIEVCSMYPITPATSVSHYLAAMLPRVGGFLHQAEDEIAAIGFALGASYAGKTAVTVTSGPGLALKTEFIGLAVMAELPLVIVDVQRGSPSTGLPTRVEQGDLLAAVHGEPGDAPKIVIAPSTIEECFHFVITARKLAEAFRGPVIVLSDANLANGQTSFARPVVQPDWLAPPIDQSPWDEDVPPYDWDPETGLSQRPIPGQRGGQYVLTGLTHDRDSKVVYDSATNQLSMAARSRKLATLQRTLKPPKVYGDETGDLLIVGWGSTRGAIEEAVDRVRAKGGSVSSLILRFLSPLEPGLREIFARFKKVKTIELNYSDLPEDPGVQPENRRYSELAVLLRAHTLCDVDCWSRVLGIPLPPDVIQGVIEDELARLNGD